MKKLTLATVFAASTFLAACGGGDDNTELVATADVSAPVSALNVAAAANEPFTFSTGVGAFGTTTPTTVTLDSTTTFTVSSTQGTANGDLSFGSCIFTVTSSTFLPGSPLASGGRVEVQPCNLSIDTSGLRASQNAVARAVSFVLGGNASQAKNLQVDIGENGVVTVNGKAVATVTLVPTTGGASN
jgi:hypothetical protein